MIGDSIIKEIQQKKVQKGVSELPVLQLMKLSDRNYNYNKIR